MRTDKAAKSSGTKNRFHSIGFQVGIIISIVLLLVLGIKAGSDIAYNYKMTTERDAKNKLEETRRLAKELEVRFAAAYQTGSDLRAILQSSVENEPMAERNRETVIGNMTQMFNANNYLFGIGVYFEPNAFDGKDMSNVSEASKSGRFTAYV